MLNEQKNANFVQLKSRQTIKHMRRKSIIALALASLLLVACSKSLNSDYTPGTAQWELATFINNLNSGQYEAALTQLNVNPVASGDITIEEFQEVMSRRITNNGTVAKIEMAEKAEEFDDRTVRIDVDFTYQDGTTKRMWVNMEQSDTAWHVTTRGTMF